MINTVCKYMIHVLIFYSFLVHLQEASRIRQEADDTKERATYLKDEADNLALDVSDVERQIADREKQADDDSALTNDVRLPIMPARCTRYNIM